MILFTLEDNLSSSVRMQKCKIETVIATYPLFHSYTHYLETLEAEISVSAVK